MAVLAWSLVKVGIDRLLGEKTGLALFHENYDDDRLPPVDAIEREALSRLSGCIACGRCDLGEAERIARSGGQYSGLMSIALAASRSMPDHDAAALALEHVPDDVLAAKEKVCPVRLPFLELARFVRTKAAFAEAAALGGASSPSHALPAARTLDERDARD